jgi:CRISPR-associated protein Csm3
MTLVSDFSKITNVYKFEITLKLKTPLHIGGNHEDAVSSDLPIMRAADGRPFIPGSSVKGLLRTASERVSHLLHNEKESCFLNEGGCNPLKDPAIEKLVAQGNEKEVYKEIYNHLCPVCQTFGGGSIASKIKANHVFFDSNTKTRVREGIKINRETGTVEGGALFNYEYIQPGIEFTIELEAENLTNTNKKVIALALAQLKQNLIRFGGLQARGLGEVEFVSGSIEKVEISKENRLESIAYLLGEKNTSKVQTLEDFLTETLLKEGDSE